MLTALQTAELLSVSQQFLIQAIAENRLPFITAQENQRHYQLKDVLAYKANRDYAPQELFDDFAVPVQVQVHEQPQLMLLRYPS